MKSILLLFLLNAILFVSAQYDVFYPDVPGCTDKVIELNQCTYYCNKYGQITGYGSNYEITFYLDSQCTQLGYIANTNIPFIIPFNCNQEYNQFGSDGQIQCVDSEPEPESESESESAQYDVFYPEVPGCMDAVIELNQCTYYCNKYGQITGYGSNYEITFYLDSQCTQLGYVNNVPFIIPFNCNQEYNQFGSDGQIQCVDSEPEPEPESESSESAQYDVFYPNVPGCTDAVIELNQCTYYCNKYGKITGDDSNYKITFYLDSQCTQLGYVNNVPLIIPFNCNQEYNQFGSDGKIQCVDSEPKPEPESESESDSKPEPKPDFSFSSSSLIQINFTFIIISISLILFIFKNN